MADRPFYALGVLAALLSFAAVGGALAGSVGLWAVAYAPGLAIAVGLLRDFTKPLPNGGR